MNKIIFLTTALSLIAGNAFASNLVCSRASYSTRCDENGKCNPPPPVPLVVFATAPIVMEKTAKAQYGSANIKIDDFKIGSTTYKFGANATVSAKLDGTGSGAGVSLSVEDPVTGAAYGSDSRVSATDANLFLALPAKISGSGTLTDHIAIFCAITN